MIPGAKSKSSSASKGDLERQGSEQEDKAKGKVFRWGNRGFCIRKCTTEYKDVTNPESL